MMFAVMKVVMLERLIMGAFLLFVGVLKIRKGRNRLLESILGYDLIPERVAAILAGWFPWLEVLSGLMLIFGFMSRFAALLTFGLFLIYTAAITISLMRGMDNDCGCFERVTPVQWRLVYRNIILMGLLLPLYEFNGGATTIGEWITNHRNFWFFSDGFVVLFILWGTILVVSFVLHRLFHKQIHKQIVRV